MKTKWQTLASESMFTAHPWLEVVRQTIKLPNGNIINDFYQILQPDYVEIVAVNEKQQIQGLWHYKHGVKHEHLGLPAGYLEKDEQPLAAAQRELLEECRLQSDSWQKLGEFVMEGNRTTAKGHFYLARNCQPSPLQLPSDDLEESRLVWLSIDQWLNHLAKGEVAVIGAATAILLAHQALKLKGEI
jgi:ADP-ribose pyrophosphatase